MLKDFLCTLKRSWLNDKIIHRGDKIWVYDFINNLFYIFFCRTWGYSSTKIIKYILGNVVAEYIKKAAEKKTCKYCNYHFWTIYDRQVLCSKQCANDYRTMINQVKYGITPEKKIVFVIDPKFTKRGKISYRGYNAQR